MLCYLVITWLEIQQLISKRIIKQNSLPLNQDRVYEKSQSTGNKATPCISAPKFSRKAGFAPEDYSLGSAVVGDLRPVLRETHREPRDSFSLIRARTQPRCIPRQPRESWLSTADSPFCRLPSSEKRFKVQLDTNKVLMVRIRSQGWKPVIHLLCRFAGLDQNGVRKRQSFQHVQKIQTAINLA